MKKIFALNIVALMILTLCACSDSKKEPSSSDLYGTWTAELNFFDFACDQLKNNISDDVEFHSSIPATVTFKFTDKGNYVISFECDDDDWDDFIDDFAQHQVDAILYALEEQGVDTDDYLETYEKQYSETLLEHYQSLSRNLQKNNKELWFNTDIEGTFALSDGKLKLTRLGENVSMDISLNGEQLTVSKMEGDIYHLYKNLSKYDGTELPWVFEKQ